MSKRKSRKPRLNSARWLAAPRFDLTAENWEALEQAIGKSFNEDQREQVVSLVRKYLFWEGAERAAPFAADADAWLTELKAVALKLEGLVVTEPMKKRAVRSRLADVQSKIDELHRLEARLGSPPDLGTLALHLVRAADCNFSQDRPPGLEEGSRWRELVRDLLERFLKWDLPTGIRKDSDKSADETFNGSPVVRFFFALQKHFPEECRRYGHSIPALAKAMGDARELTRPRKGHGRRTGAKVSVAMKDNLPH